MSVQGQNPTEIEFIYSVGEASGDRQASALQWALIESAPQNLTAIGSGICGEKMKAAGIEPVVDCSGWGSMGVAEALRQLPSYQAGMSKIKAHLSRKRGKKIALILVDFGYFNVRLAKWARENGIGPIIYFMPPGSWKRRAMPGALHKFVQLCDLIVTPFQWSDEQLRAVGGNSFWLGHPLIDTVKPTLSQPVFDKKFGIGPNERVVALLPGSRVAEIANILPMMLKSAKLISEQANDVRFVIAASSKANRGLVEQVVARAGDGIKAIVVEDATYDCLARCDFAIITSGTATLEAAILAKPMVIAYGGSWIIEMEYKLRRRSLKIEHFGLPNIISGERIVPEIIFLDGKGAGELAKIALSVLNNTAEADRIGNSLREKVIPELGEPGVVNRASERIWDFLHSRGVLS